MQFLLNTLFKICVNLPFYMCITNFVFMSVSWQKEVIFSILPKGMFNDVNAYLEDIEHWRPMILRCTFAATTVKELDLKSLQVEQRRPLLKDKGCRELRSNVLLAQTTNFQHTSLLKCSLKLKLHQLRAYKPPYLCSFTVKAQPLNAIPVSLDQSLCTGNGPTNPEPVSHSYT